MSLEENPPTFEEPTRERGRGCLFIIISSIIIFSLLATSIASLVWFITERTAENYETSLPAFDQATAGDDRSTSEEVTVTAMPETETAPEVVDSVDGVQGVEASASLDAAVQESRVNRIVLVNEERQIETVSSDGSERHMLTEEDHFYEFPAWAPDGSQIAVLGSDRSGGGIFLLRDEDDFSKPLELYFSRDRRPFYLYWSPDSGQISFLANNPVDGIGLNLINAELGEENREIAAGSPFYWNWTADSKRMLIHSGNEEDDSRLVLIDSNGEDQGPQIPAPGFFQAPGISPSGRYWAYSQLGEGGIPWITVDDQVSGEQNVERHAGSIALNWSPVADRLAFISGTDDERVGFWGPLRLLDIESGETKLLSANTVLAFFWSPDGKLIFTVSIPANDNFNGSVEVRETKTRHLARNQPAVTPTQRLPHQFMLSVIDTESGTGLELATVTLSPTFLTQFLVYFDQYALSHTLWSPDSDQIVMPIIADGENKIVVISTTSGRMHQVGNGTMAFWSRQ